MPLSTPPACGGSFFKILEHLWVLSRVAGAGADMREAQLLGAADPRSFPVGHGTTPRNPGSGQRVRRRVSCSRFSHRHRGGRNRPTVALAETVCGKGDRVHQARVLGPRDCPQRVASSADPRVVPRVLPPISYALLAGKGHTRRAIGPALRCREDCRVPPGRRTASSVRAARGLNTAGFRLRVLVWRLDATGIAMDSPALPAAPRAFPMAGRQIQSPFPENTLSPSR